MTDRFSTSFSRRHIIGATASALAVGVPHLHAAQAPVAQAAGSRGQTFFNVLEMGAVPDAKTKNTEVLQRAIDACAAAGGGTVYVPPGVYITGALRLVSNLVLYLEAGSVIKGSPDVADYTLPPSEPGGRPRRSGLITANDAENISIIGRGAIDGNGPAFVDSSRVHHPRDFDPKYIRQKEAFLDPAIDTEGPHPPRSRPGNMIRLTNCRKVLFRDVTLQNSPSWNLHFVQCDDVGVFGITIHSLDSDRRVPNDDGIDISGCRNMRMTGCVIRTGDDCIAVFDADGLVVSDCVLEAKSSAIRVGYGAHNTDGNIRNCVFSNITITGNRAICVNVRGPHSVENVQFSNIQIRTRLHTGHWWGKAEPIHISAALAPGMEKLGRIRNIQFDNIDAQCEHGVVIFGVEDSVIRKVGLRNVRLVMTGGPLHKAVGGNFDLRATRDPSIGLFEHDISAVFARYVDGLDIANLEVEWQGELPPYFTHAIQVENFRDLEISGFRGRQAHTTANTAAIALSKGQGVTIRDCRAAEGTATFLALNEVTGQRMFVNNDLAAAKELSSPQKTQFLSAGNRMPGRR
ncbi:MAG TPA: glycosyl hydrolase family 28 protein [Bryobacteraceae bacterium]|nr:glycosyl hydrolase family 28 protein [Bryobacteraceae bacterium]HPU72443.1 glycosyl hydrolase family 28 protein [Bryobacteraceae bacterium]